MTESIIDDLKVVNVHQCKRQWSAGPHRPCHLCRSLALPGPRVEQSGLGINARCIYQLVVPQEGTITAALNTLLWTGNRRTRSWHSVTLRIGTVNANTGGSKIAARSSHTP